GVLIFTSFIITNIFLLFPLCLFILHSGIQQWWRNNRSASSMSHSDFFTFHLAVIELLGVFGCVLGLCAPYSNQSVLVTAVNILSFSSFGGVYFHVLTCVDRYLAVLHPLTYMSLKKDRGFRIRHVCVCCVWLLGVVETALMTAGLVFIVLNFCVLILSLASIFYCTLSVLRALISPGPAKQLKGKKKVDQMKQRALHTILAITGALAMRFSFTIAWAVTIVLGINMNCVMLTMDVWLNLPSSLVLPALFLQKAGKFACLKTNLVFPIPSCS
uniref:G-protein coupled receptors family 1 profile domain-containing protein n=1 Tax=Poecilia formosa TaxID=48698 RepID=A0A096MBW3_POEFO